MTPATGPVDAPPPGDAAVFSAARRIWVTAAICGLTLLGYFVFPGHTYLQSDTQIYVPILEHLHDPGTLARDSIGAYPHVAYTIFDEVSIAMRWILRTGFEQVLTIQQVAFRAMMLLGVYWIAVGFRLSTRMSVLVAVIFSLGATVVGPTVLTVEYEPIPRGFAFCFLLLSLGLLAQDRTWLASLAASIALLYHPPTVWTFWPLFGSMLASRLFYHRDRGGEARRGLLAGAACLGLLLIAARLQPGIAEPQVFLSRFDAVHEKLLRLRATYIWVSLWPRDVVAMYFVMWGIAGLAWFRLRRYGSRALDWMLLGLPAAGALSIHCNGCCWSESTGRSPPSCSPHDRPCSLPPAW